MPLANYFLWFSPRSAANKERRLSAKFSKSAVDSSLRRESASPSAREQVTQHVRSKSDNPPPVTHFGFIEEEEQTTLHLAQPPRVSRSITMGRLPNRPSVDSSNGNPYSALTSSGSSLPQRASGSDKNVQHMEAAWQEFLSEVKSHLRQSVSGDSRQEAELQENIRLKALEIEQLKRRIAEVTAKLSEEERRILKYENENCELSMKVLDYQLLALKK